MQRVLKRYRNWVRVERVEKVKAAFKLQAAWWNHQQRRRIRQRAASSVLVNFFRCRIKRICAAKTTSALLLQRVFRSQRDRHFVHWMYGQMKYNRALLLIKQFLVRCVARRCRINLSLQRDERLMCCQQYAMTALSIIREERSDLMAVLRFAETTSSSFLKLLVPPDLAKCETTHGEAPLPLEENWENNLRRFSREPDDAESHFSEKSGALALTSSLHSEEGARQLLGELFYMEMQAPVQPNTRSPVSLSHSLQTEPRAQHKPSVVIQLDATSDDALSQDHAFIPLIDSTKSPILKRGRGSIAVSSWNGSNAPLNQLMEAFVELILRTESIERKALVWDIEQQRKEMFQKIECTSATFHATSSSPALYASLLAHMKESWAVRKAEQLFSQEHEERMKVIEEYMAIPLRFLDRPLLNSAAEDRRRRVKERFQVHCREGSRGMQSGRLASVSVCGEEDYHDENDPFAPTRSPVSNCNQLQGRATAEPLAILMNREPPPPPPRAVHSSMGRSPFALRRQSSMHRCRQEPRGAGASVTVHTDDLSHDKNESDDLEELPQDSSCPVESSQSESDDNTRMRNTVEILSSSDMKHSYKLSSPLCHSATQEPQDTFQAPILPNKESNATTTVELRGTAGKGYQSVTSYHTVLGDPNRRQNEPPHSSQSCFHSSARQGIGAQLTLWGIRFSSENGPRLPILRASRRVRCAPAQRPTRDVDAPSQALKSRESGSDFVRFGPAKCQVPLTTGSTEDAL
ncbi:hypothetical protein ERJ75_000936200 [Trypanosoma vivax]|nr:hypothetical protein ERJ75_000936200 [Trypanosoma vivax]